MGSLVVEKLSPRARAAGGRPGAPARWDGVVLALAVAAALSRLVFVAAPLSPDEGGFLLVASHWSRGAATYGASFVDRPPLLIALFAVAHELGGRVALRVLGMVAVLAAVLIAGRMGERYGGRRAGRYGAATGAMLVVTPLFGVTIVDGELLALPFLLGGTAALLVAARADVAIPRRRTAAVLAGALGACSVLIKQNLIDVFVALAAVAVLVALQQRRRAVVHLLLPAAAGAAATLLATLTLASLRGTTPARLWDALIVFRAQAGQLIGADPGGGTTIRLHQMLVAGALSAAPLIAAAALAVARRPCGPLSGRIDLRWVALPMLLWAVVAALLGGSYWQHYLIELVPGLVLLAIAAAATGTAARVRRLLAGALAIAAVSALLALVQVARHPSTMTDDAEAVAYLRDHARRDDTVVVGFGHPDIAAAAGLSSPYPYLWSLPARVRDPRLATLSALLDGPSAPRWVVVAGTSLATWGIDATAGDDALAAHYRPVGAAGTWRIYQHD